MGSNTYTEKTEIKPIAPGQYYLDRSTGTIRPRGPENMAAMAPPGQVAGDIVEFDADGIISRITLGGEVSLDATLEIVTRVFPGRHFELLEFVPTQTTVNTRGQRVSEFITAATAVAGSAEDE